MNKAVFLDRDGVINIDSGYVGKIEDFMFVDGIIPALLHAQQQGFLLIVVTNQSGIGRGFYTEEDFQRLTAWMKSELARHGVFVDAVFHCPHTDADHCACRKPKAGLFLQAIDQYDVDCDNSWMVGDSERDIQAALAAGIGHTVLFDPDNNKATAAGLTITSLNELSTLLT
ncbi:MAG: D-glycero-beta-D-manno-heptose 1,7-bisphosphate 7-phosphatase [Pseudomonadota bacterium]